MMVPKCKIDLVQGDSEYQWPSALTAAVLQRKTNVIGRQVGLLVLERETDREKREREREGEREILSFNKLSDTKSEGTLSM